MNPTQWGRDMASLPTSARSSTFAGVTCSANKCPNVSTAMCSFEPRLRLPPSYPARGPLSGVERNVRLSIMAAVGSSLRPAARRKGARKSCARYSNTPAARVVKSPTSRYH